jgi:RNA polymerase sigma-70 factor (ECF subfamily)
VLVVRAEESVESAGAVASFETLFAANYDDLMRYAVRRVGADAAGDVVAEVFLIAWRRRGDYGPDAARLWLFGVAHNVLANEQRAQRRRTDLRQRAQVDLGRASGPDPADLATTAVYVRQVLSTLPWREQEALRLTEWEQLEPAEAATVVGCSPPAFRARLHRARRRLARRLSDSEGQLAGAAATTSSGASRLATGGADEEDPPK